MRIDDRYIIRSPVLTKDYIDQIYKEENLSTILIELLHNPILMERILVASQSLYYQLLQYKEKNTLPLDSKAASALVKYILRMASRSMPFGLFAGIQEASFSDIDQPTSNTHAQAHKHVKVSIEWYKEVIKKIEQKQGIHSTLTIKMNPLIVEREKYIVLESSSHNQYKKMRIDKVPFLQLLLNLLNSPIKMKKVIERISNDDPQKQQTILQTIEDLLQKGFIISELNPTIPNTNQCLLEGLLNKNELLSREDENKLKEIQLLLQQYKTLPVGEGIDVFLRLVDKMKKWSDTSRCLVVDLFQQNEREQTFTKHEIANVAQKLSFMSVFTAVNYEQTWSTYIMRFLERYGYFNEVKLLDAIDEDLGIGMPTMTDDWKISKENRQYNQFLLNKIMETKKEAQDVVSLQEKDIEHIQSIYSEQLKNKQKNGYDFKVSILKDKGESLFSIGTNSFGNTACSFTGRFYTKEKRTAAQYSLENDEYISAEINAIPHHYGDLSVTYQQPNYVININTITNMGDAVSFPVNELYVGVDKAGLYIRSKNSNKKILPVCTHMLHYNNFIEDKALLFLSLYGKYKSRAPMDFYLGPLRTLKRIPRIQYGCIILSPKRWNISKSNINGENDREKALKEFVKENEVDQVVYLLNGDKTLPLKLQTALGRSLLLQALAEKKNEEEFITLIEAPELNEQQATTRNNVDYVFTVLPDNQNSKVSAPLLTKIQTNIVKEEWDWEYFKVFPSVGYNEKALDLCLQFFKKNSVKKFFYVQYVEEGKLVLRIRFQSKYKHVKEIFAEWLKELYVAHIICDYSSHLFIPEINRYGGEILYEKAYHYFCEESALLHKLNLENLIPFNEKVEKGMIFTLFTTIDLFGNYADAKAFLESVAGEKNKDILKKFKANRPHYTQVANYAIDLYKKYQTTHMATKQKVGREYSELLWKELHPDQALYTLNSILHMTLNRVIGVDRKVEQEVYELSSYALYNLKYLLQIKGGYDELSRNIPLYQ
ncbi:thiopeptide-type bacteriocin biosynthesis protein [Bacillus alkalisoli]|uniref:thiopeptide-type bacteriocin biosynthesis protein n=1 Tax=Bacillus alkalisoli TaxID=2011008 RepID=UPI000C238662|nr:thiopeptide-type bacteriocin biosynthesis protein [Bacillus alkalisoli]